MQSAESVSLGRRARSIGGVLLPIVLSAVAGGSLPASAACIPQPPNLVSWWPGDGHPFDLMGQNNATLVNGVTYGPGLIGEAFSLDGNVANYVEIPNGPTLNPTGTFTVNGWFYIDPNAPGNDNGVSSLVAKTDGSVGDGGWFLWFQDSAVYTNALRFDIMTWGSPAWPFAEVDNIIPSAAWYHVAGVFDLAATPQAKLYLNGALVASSSSTISALLNNSRTMRIGASHWTDAYGGNDRLEGLAEEVQFFDRALSAAEIAAIYAAGSEGQCKPCTAPPSNLVSWWKAEDNADDSIDGNHGTLQNGATFAPGQAGQAFSFDGANDYVEMPQSANLSFEPNQPMSVELWIKRTSTSGSQIVFAKRPDCGASVHYAMQWYEPGNWFVFGSAAGGGSTGVSTTADRLPLDTWTYVAIAFDGATATMYINGVPVASHEMSFVPVATPLRLGGEPSCDGQLFGGLLDEVRIYDRALTVQEIATIYACAVPSPTIFVDGFESGGTGAWSATVGGL